MPEIHTRKAGASGTNVGTNVGTNSHTFDGAAAAIEFASLSIAAGTPLKNVSPEAPKSTNESPIAFALLSRVPSAAVRCRRVSWRSKCVGLYTIRRQLFLRKLSFIIDQKRGRLGSTGLG